MAVLNTDTVMEVYERWAELNRQLDDLAEQQKKIKKKLAHIAEEELPQVLGGFPGIMLPNGEVLRVNRGIVSVTPIAATREDLYDWIIKDGDSGLIKNEVTAIFPVDQAGEADVLAQELGARYNVSKRRWVEPSTLTKHVKTLLEQGKQVPEELLHIRYKTEVTVE